MFSTESRQLLKNIVYLRDTSILQYLDKRINQISQREIFQHENYLDVTELIKEREIQERWEGLDSSSPLMKARKRILYNLQVNQDSSCYQQPRQSDDDLTLQFESRFESGNLYMA